MADLLSSPCGELDAEDGKPSMLNNFANKANTYHSRIPYVRKLPLSAIAIILTLIFVNIVVWAGVGVVLVCGYIRAPYSRNAHL
jgi:high-affinity nickel-transport protein